MIGETTISQERGRNRIPRPFSFFSTQRHGDTENNVGVGLFFVEAESDAACLVHETYFILVFTFTIDDGKAF